VLKAHYGDKGSRVGYGGRLSSIWWTNLTSIGEGVGLEAGS